MSKLVCKNLTKTYKDVCALDNVSLEIEENKIYGLIGRNGAGKTTLLKSMVALTLPTKGNVYLDSEPIFENEEALSNLCLIRGFGTVGGNAFGSTNMMYFQKISKILDTCKYFYKNWDEDLAKSLIKEFDIDLKKNYTKLSSGTQSAVNIVIGLSSCAPITLLDEPTAGLDVYARDRFYSILLKEYERLPRTFIISTHLIEESSPIFEDIIFINDGKIEFVKETDKLRNEYVYVSGKCDVIDNLTKDITILNKESIGSKSVVCLKKKDIDDKISSINSNLDNSSIEVDQVPLQKLFVYLCRGGR